MIKTIRGFTLVELATVIVILSILSTLGLVEMGVIQAKSRDAERNSKITILSNYLEKYYQQNGEYPSCTAMSQPVGTITTSTLPGLNQSALTSPSDDPGTNSILGSCSDLTVGNDKFAYVGDGTAACLTGTSCTKYQLKYYGEESNTVISVSSQHSMDNIITAIGAITGTPQMGQTLTAGAVTPAGATVSYQWQSSATSGGAYTDIVGATASTYIPDLTVAGQYIKVIATGINGYTGSQTSAATAQVALDSNWLVIGTQTWATKNLNVGTMVAGVTTQTNNSTTEKYCYNDTESNCTTYGGFYQWDEAMQYVNYEGAQGLCPAGSHVPSDNDWKVLEIQLGMTQAQADLSGQYRGTNQGTQLKPSGTSGLNMQLSGNRYLDGSFVNFSSFGVYWTSSESSTKAWNRYLDKSQSGVYRSLPTKTYGYSVRCLKN